MIEVPQSDEVVTERAVNTTKRNAIVGGLAAVVLLAGSAAAIATTRHSDPSVVTHQTACITRVLEFRRGEGLPAVRDGADDGAAAVNAGAVHYQVDHAAGADQADARK